MVGLVILYWVDKYLLLRRYTCNYYLDQKLAEDMINMLPLYAVLFSFGNIFVMCIPILKSQSLAQFEWPDFYSNEYFYLALTGFAVSLVCRYLVKIPYVKQLYFMMFSIQVPSKKIKGTYAMQGQVGQQDYEKYHPVLRQYVLQQGGEERKEQSVAVFSSVQDLKQMSE